MKLEDEITRAVKHQAAIETGTRKTEEEIQILINNVVNTCLTHHYDFTKSETIILNQGGKNRFVKRYVDDYSPEGILSQCIKQIIDRIFRVRYPNRNKSIRLLFDIFRAIKQMSDFTIVKFDFKDYFNSVSSEYVFEKYIKTKLSDRTFYEIINDYTKKTKYAYAGLKTSNVISEIIAIDFDRVIKRQLSDKGIIYYERYIDDTFLVFNEHVDDAKIKKIIYTALNIVFHDNEIMTSSKCKTRFNNKKYKYISKRTLSANPTRIDYLGYEFHFTITSGKCKIMYGITQEKRDKNNYRIDKLIKLYTDTTSPDYDNMELLRHRISAFSSRCVYRVKKFKSTLWKTKGFISNYCELRFLLDSDYIIPDTDRFLKNMIIDGFIRAGIPLPYFINGARGKAGYNLFHNMKVNKTLLFVENIGYDKNSLKKICNSIGIKSEDVKRKKRGYGNLVKD
jgi:hypothetical protein